MTEPFWKGAFAKHRLGTGDISNHLEVLSYDIEGDASSGWTAHVVVGFIGNAGVAYEYDVEVEGVDVTDDELIALVLEETHNGLDSS